MNKIEKINKYSHESTLKKFLPSFSFKNKINYGGFTREQKLQIDSVNKYFINKISNRCSFYKNKEWEKDFQKAQYFKKNVCEYPVIDFYGMNRSNKKSGFLSNSPSCFSFTNNKNKSLLRVKLKPINRSTQIKKEEIKDEKNVGKENDISSFNNNKS